MNVHEPEGEFCLMRFEAMEVTGEADPGRGGHGEDDVLFGEAECAEEGAEVEAAIVDGAGDEIFFA